MKLSRKTALFIHWIFDQLTPPVIRDSKIFYLVFKYIFKDESRNILTFKENLSHLNDEEINKIYNDTAKYHIKRETDLNEPCIKQILKDVKGQSVCEVATGRGFLAKKLADLKDVKVTAVDIRFPDGLKEANPHISFIEAFAHKLPFANKEFDTVIATHMLEHVKDFDETVAELRRIAKIRLILVVPMQRPYKYTFDLHVNFFPYPYMFTNRLKKIPNTQITVTELGGDIYYLEDKRV